MDIRPTSDRLRETLFNVLCAGNPEALAGSVWFDLYAGTGAVGIEALSRAAAWVNFVESSPQAAALIEKNLKSLGIAEGFKIVRSDVMSLSKLGAADAGDFFFVDPPYRMEAAYKDTLEMLAESQLVKPSSVIIAEHDRRFDPGEIFGRLRRYRLLKQGDSCLSFYKIGE